MFESQLILNPDRDDSVSLVENYTMSSGNFMLYSFKSIQYQNLESKHKHSQEPTTLNFNLNIQCIHQDKCLNVAKIIIEAISILSLSPKAVSYNVLALDTANALHL